MLGFWRSLPTCPAGGPRRLGPGPGRTGPGGGGDYLFRPRRTVEYAKKRTRDHIARFTYLYRALTGDLPEGGLDEAILRDFEWRDNIFPEIDYRVYR